ncbi:MAG: fimbrillin family protein [Bacteroidales bacterium]|nr:fimbrillin family protein [Bacteroidales bacterium]
MKRLFKSLFLTLPVMLAAAFSCTEKDPDNASGTEHGKVCLKIEDVTAAELTKSAIKGTSFPTDEDISLGLFIAGEDCIYNNVKATRKAGETDWATESDIVLNDKPATVYAYYPYDKDASSVSDITVSSSLNGKDWMWATPVTDVSAAKPGIKLTMNHALALIEITFNTSGFESTAKMTEISLSGASFSKDGSMNAGNGFITAGDAATGSGAFISAADLPLGSGNAITADCLLVPTSTSDERQDLTVACTFAGNNYRVNLSGDTKGVVIKPGIKSTVTLNIKNGENMEVASVSIDKWNGGISGNSTTVNGHTVTVSGNTPVILSYETSVSSDGAGSQTGSRTLVIKYDKSRLSNDGYVLDYEKTGTGTIIHDPAEGVFRLIDIQSDITLAVNIVRTFKVTLFTNPESVNKSYLPINSAVFLTDTNGNRLPAQDNPYTFIVPEGKTVVLKADLIVRIPGAETRYHKNWKDSDNVEYPKNFQFSPTSDKTFTAIYTEDMNDIRK